jgi:aminotransferase
MNGATPIYVDTTQHAFKLTAELIAPNLSDKTRCIVIASPSNPTGAILTEEEQADIARLLRDRDVFVISDEIYSELVYEGVHHSIATQPGMREKTIVINGLSKSHSMTGWRIGFTFAPAYLTKHMIKVLQYNITCASSISQHAAIAALTAGIDDAQPMREAYIHRRNFVFDQLLQAGFDVHLPGGAFYIFPSVRSFGMDSTTFAYQLLEQQRVAVVPGTAFSALGEGFIRISYACSMEILEASMTRIRDFVRSL